jgi:hypothetical protein
MDNVRYGAIQDHHHDIDPEFTVRAKSEHADAIVTLLAACRARFGKTVQ